MGAVIKVEVDPTNIQTSAHLTASLYLERRKYINEFPGQSRPGANQACAGFFWHTYVLALDYSTKKRKKDTGQPQQNSIEV